TQPSRFEGAIGRAALFPIEAERAGSYAHLENFFAECAAIVLRYRGRVLGPHGHELLFYFHEKEPADQARLALAVARDLEELAAEKNESLAIALAFGRMRSGQVLSGHA